jgi:hypothetical protein
VSRRIMVCCIMYYTIILCPTYLNTLAQSSTGAGTHTHVVMEFVVMAFAVQVAWKHDIEQTHADHLVAVAVVVVAFRGHALEVALLVVEHTDPAACPRVCACKCLYIMCVRVNGVCLCRFLPTFTNKNPVFVPIVSMRGVPSASRLLCITSGLPSRQESG